MSTPFLTILKSECARFAALYPEREGEISRTQAMIIAGGVLEMDDGNGQVCSRDGQKWYTVNSHCDCQAGSYGKPCRHLAAWKLFQHVQKKMQGLGALETPAPVEPPVEPWPDNDIPAAPACLPQSTSVETETVAAPLPEAPASVNCYITMAGRPVQLTLRDTSEERLLERLKKVLEQFPVEPKPASQPLERRPGPAPAPLSPQQTGWCAAHDCTMRLNTGKDGRQWWSHKLPEGGFCKGR